MTRSKVFELLTIVASFVLCCFLLFGWISSRPQRIPQSTLDRLEGILGDQAVNGVDRFDSEYHYAEPEEEYIYTATEIDLIHELEKAEIIPDVIDTFTPLLTVKVKWGYKTAQYGNTLAVNATQDTPRVVFLDYLPGTSTHSSDKTWSSHSKHPQLTIVITDPDAPSRDNPEWSEVCHWIATNVHLSSQLVDDEIEVVTGPGLQDVLPYKPPGPPEKTGKHRYVMVALVPLNRTMEKLHLTPPEDRRRWGYERERQGLRKWAEEMGLGVVGANFIYEQNEVQ